MTLAPVQPMDPKERKKGRPKGAGGTKMVRLKDDLTEMIGWIVRIAKKKDPNYTAALLCDPLLRPQIEMRYKGIEAEVEQIKKSEDSAAEKDAPEESAE